MSFPMIRSIEIKQECKFNCLLGGGGKKGWREGDSTVENFFRKLLQSLAIKEQFVSQTCFMFSN